MNQTGLYCVLSLLVNATVLFVDDIVLLNVRKMNLIKYLTKFNRAQRI